MLVTAIFAAAISLSVYDGDTIKLDGEEIRILGYDAPETKSPKCDAEAMLGALAKTQLMLLLAQGSPKVDRLPKEEQKDPYKRTLARLTIEGVDISERMIRSGTVVPWEGRRHKWCSRD